MFKIVADDKIPYVKELFSPLGKLIQKPGTDIHHNELIDADILLVRTITQVDASLLKNTAVKFVASASAGHDHIDNVWLNKAGIAWAYAPGANAQAVANYVIGCINYLVKQKLLTADPRAGVIGVGHVGTAVTAALKQYGFEVFCNDPPRAAQEDDFISIPLSKFYELDLICVHTPLTTTGIFSTYHLLNQAFFNQLKPGCVILNAGRGAVVDNQALLATRQLIACLDVWENEPNINLDLLKKAVIATPHIAGYSQPAKLRATLMIYEKTIQFLQTIKANYPRNYKIIIHDFEKSISHHNKSLYNPQQDTAQMKAVLLKHPNEVSHYFRQLRREYPLRVR